MICLERIIGRPCEVYDHHEKCGTYYTAVAIGCDAIGIIVERADGRVERECPCFIKFTDTIVTRDWKQFGKNCVHPSQQCKEAPHD